MNAYTLWLRRLTGLIGFRIAFVLLVVVGVAAVAPQAIASLSPATGDPRECSLRAPGGGYQDRLAPSGAHWFGTDVQGCDQFARVLSGARTSLGIAVGAGLLMTAIGAALGMAAGCRGGWVDSLVRRMGDVTYGIPFVVGAILLLTVLVEEQRTALQIVVTLAVLLWPGTARVARTATRGVMTRSYVEAARAAGASDWWIVKRHVLPNTLPMIVAFATPAFGALVGVEATLSFLGVGLQSPSVSWGLMIAQGQDHFERSPHLLLIPGAFLAVTVAGFILLGDAIADSLDPHVEVRGPKSLQRSL